MKIKAKYKVDENEDFVSISCNDEEKGKKIIEKFLSRKNVDKDTIVYEIER